jgi:cation diffusion facilitator CzcD-associated flavoprotein CzcO
VIGAGNSGCDAAVEVCRVAKKTAISMRRGYHFIPKFVFGEPADVIANKFQNLQIKTASSLLPAVNKPQEVALAKSVPKKKFASLQQKLKQSQAEQERLACAKEKSFGSLASFLQNLT